MCKDADKDSGKTYLSMTGPRRLQGDGDTATCSTPLDKYLARPQEQHCSWYQFASKCGKVPVISGDATHAIRPILFESVLLTAF